jgi:Universal stress protein UspA and related nucleotide-binding proteins
MEEKLITLAIHTFQKAQILKLLLESEGIEVYLHNVNLIQPVVSAGVRVRIKESDLPAALKVIEENPSLQEVAEHPEHVKPEDRKILLPVDFSDYSEQACELGFRYAHEVNAEVIVLHSFMTPYSANPMTFTDSFTMTDEMNEIAGMYSADIAQKELDDFEEKLQKKIAEGRLPQVSFTTALELGLPEERIVYYTKQYPIRLVIMGTRGKNQKDMELIGSVTADVINRSKVPVLALPEKTPFRDLKDVKRIAFGTSFDQKDLLAVDSLIKMFTPYYNIEYYLFHLAHKKDTWDEIQLGGIKEYYEKQYPGLTFQYEVIDANDFLVSMERFINDYKINIISLTTHKRNIFTRLFNPSVAHKMLFHTDTPLLAFHS